MVLYHCNLGAVMSDARKAGEYLGLGLREIQLDMEDISRWVRIFLILRIRMGGEHFVWCLVQLGKLLLNFLRR